jgi:hypothetical protein
VFKIDAAITNPEEKVFCNNNKSRLSKTMIHPFHQLKPQFKRLSKELMSDILSGDFSKRLYQEAPLPPNLEGFELKAPQVWGI